MIYVEYIDHAHNAKPLTMRNRYAAPDVCCLCKAYNCCPFKNETQFCID